MKTKTAKKLGAPFRNGALGMYQEFLVTMEDGTELRVMVPTAYGKLSSAQAKTYAESGHTY